MRLLICPDSYKGTLSPLNAAEAIAEGVRAADPEMSLDLLPLADGGEGTTAALTGSDPDRHRERSVRVPGPLGEPVDTRFALLADGRAVVEAASCSGLTLVPPTRRDPLRASSYGLGQTIAKALTTGPRELIVAIGGTATVDGGVGMAQALGCRLLDGAMRELPPSAAGGALRSIAAIDRTGALPELRAIPVTVVADVRNPLLGPRGAAAVYAPQKGADAAQVAELEAGLTHLTVVARRDLDPAFASLAGSGAGGGIAAMLSALTRAPIVGGASWVGRELDLERRLEAADAVITGEGRLDSQTADGKVCAEVLGIANRLRRPVAVLAGSLGSDPPIADSQPFARAIVVDVSAGIERDAATLADSARQLLVSAACEVVARLRLDCDR